MQPAVQQCGGQRGVSGEGRVPLAERQVAGHDQAALFVQRRDHLEARHLQPVPPPWRADIAAARPQAPGAEPAPAVRPASVAEHLDVELPTQHSLAAYEQVIALINIARPTLLEHKEGRWSGGRGGAPGAIDGDDLRIGAVSIAVAARHCLSPFGELHARRVAHGGRAAQQIELDQRDPEGRSRLEHR
jgi:hypothetical protein